MKRLLIILLTASALSGHAQKPTDTMEPNSPYTILLLLNATPQWLSLSREARSDFFKKHVIPVFREIGRSTQVKFYDSEYFHASVSDFLIIHTSDIGDYKLLIEKLRDSKVYSAPYFEVKDIILGQENAFEDFNRQFKNDHR